MLNVIFSSSEKKWTQNIESKAEVTAELKRELEKWIWKRERNGTVRDREKFSDLYALDKHSHNAQFSNYHQPLLLHIFLAHLAN